jgi:hypothetical protein
MLTPKNFQLVTKTVQLYLPRSQASPRRSARNVARQIVSPEDTCTPENTSHKFHPYDIHFVQEFQDTDRRIQFCE